MISGGEDEAMSDDSERGRVDDAGAALILERAAKLDAGQGKWVDLTDLREAAVEAGISSSAFERAVTELKALRVRASGKGGTPAGAPPPRGGDVEPLPWTARALSWVRPALVLGAGVAIGALSGVLDFVFLVDSPGGTIFSVVLAIQMLLYLLVRHRRKGSILGFEIDLAALWAGLTFMLMLVYTGDAADIAAVLSIAWAAAGIVGAGVISLPRRSDAPKELSP